MKLKRESYISIFYISSILIFGNLFIIPIGMDTTTAGTFNQTSSSAFSNGETIFWDFEFGI